MNKKNGFTLVELLAVIVILAVILVIAVPSIMSTITESKKGSLASSAKLIASAAETMKLSNQALGIDREITCSDVANISSEDYETCKIDFINGEAKVTLVGKGKFEGMGVLLGTKDNVIATYGLEEDDTDDHNIRYVGKNPSNYIEFGNDNELWRIIGIFNMTTADGKTEKLMKIVRNDSIGEYSWDSSTGNNNGTHETGEVNDGYGVNQWGPSKYTNGNAYEGADLMRELNTLYLNQGSGTCFNGSNNVSTTCNFSTTGIKDTYRGMIEEVVWNTGTVVSGVSAKTAYEKERRETTGNVCTSGVYCTDTVVRTTTWEGRIGLIYPSNYAYASTNTSCRANINDNTNYSCKNDNWLHTGSSYWTLSSLDYSSDYIFAIVVYSSGYVDHYRARTAFGVRPSVYLKYNVSITSGEGTQASPYKLSID